MYPLERGEHEDAQPLPLAQRPPPDNAEPVRCKGKTVSNYGGGDCLYLSLDQGFSKLTGRPLAGPLKLRREYAQWVLGNGDTAVVGHKTILQWLEWGAGQRKDGRAPSLEAYARQMATTKKYAGTLELIACSQLNKVDIWVWRPVGQKEPYVNFTRFSCIEYDGHSTGR
jgi:hypothetical protein|tara:strand:+ start:80 stop:586 length:507 start_codon:yes stop_codon:yes gene_type:complete